MIAMLRIGFRFMFAAMILAASAGAILLFLPVAFVLFIDRNVPPPAKETRASTYEEFRSCGWDEDKARFLVHTHAALRRDAKGIVKCD